MTDKSELISVVISTHGRSDKIERAIRSVIAQTYSNLEIIVVDDNADNPVERMKTEDIVRKYDKVRLIKNKNNLGGGLSRNVGIEAANGKLISFLDDDDQYLPDRVKKLYSLYSKHTNENIGLAYCSCSVINNKDVVIGEYVHVLDGKPFYEQMMGCVAGTSMWLASKEALERIGGFDDVPSKQDSTVILKMLIAGYNIFGTTEKLVLYLEHQGGGGISGTKLSNADGIVKYREKCRKHYDKITKREATDVECNFSGQLVTIYSVNGRLEEARKELLNIFSNKPFSRLYFKNLAKIVFRKKHLRRLAKLEERLK